MKAAHFEILVEEPSMEAFLHEVLPRMLGDHATFTVHSYRGKPDLLKKLPARLRGYAQFLPEASRIVVLLDADGMDCAVLKQRVEDAAVAAGLSTRSTCVGVGNRNCSGPYATAVCAGVPLRAFRMASSALIPRRLAVSTTERTSA